MRNCFGGRCQPWSISTALHSSSKRTDKRYVPGVAHARFADVVVLPLEYSGAGQLVVGTAGEALNDASALSGKSQGVAHILKGG